MDLKLGHYNKDGIEVVEVEGEYPRLHGTAAPWSCSSIWSTRTPTSSSSTWRRLSSSTPLGLGVLVGGLKRMRTHNGSLDVVCTQERILRFSASQD